MNRFKKIIFTVIAGSFITISCEKAPQKVNQLAIDKVSEMPERPNPYRMINWKEKAEDFDNYIFNWEQQGEYQPFIWKDGSRRNMDQETFGLYTVIGDVRQGPDKNNGEFHESLCALGALMGGGLVGVDKTDQDGHNYVKMAQNYFNTDNQWNIVMNNTTPEIALLGGGYGRDWWYDVFPNVLYYAVADIFPNVDGQDDILKSIAEQFYKADSVLEGDYDYSFFDYSKMEGQRNHIPYQQDAAAGHAYVMLSAYHKFKDSRYLDGAESALQALLNQKESRFYEVLMPFGALVASRLNAEHGKNIDYHKILDWTFDGCKAQDGRTGWGILNEKWGDYDMSGLQGSLIDGGGYMFLMNTIDMAWPLVPMVRYDHRYADAIGKWMLNAANASRFFYPSELPDKYQWLPEKKDISNNLIAYEGIKKYDMYNKPELEGISPVALGDGPNWQVNQPEISMFSIYGSAHVGIYGAMIEETDMPEIIKLNCLTTDFYRNEAYPTYLMYNPYQEDQEITYQVSSNKPVDLFDAITKEVVAKGIEKSSLVTLPANVSTLLVEVPAGSEIVKDGEKYIANDIVISYM
ncbi:hypothetical protein [Aureibacter tunicatorum]|uniref:Uncharacterized protein n=1 Tax=Aureibacter tunicatorum TaxID=866807 RepID=A0AAE4BV52_9BACT|nr:hypothetical protein [Aureibacter tunicatorum]MDR6241527.1 hypothetical protein [Aureibacter tunicatorum]BDD07015.1 hypothetical protein AUTU_44980 [Aureibacter tunicatorum]